MNTMRCNKITPCKNAKVFIRILPDVKMCWTNIKVLSDKKTIFVRRLQDLEKGHRKSKPLFWKFRTDKVFYNVIQQEIYERVVGDDLIKSAFEGNSAIILAFGPTGTGKSLTVSGLLNSYEDRGISPRLITALYEMKSKLRDTHKVCLKMSYIETEKMYIIDLLSNDGKTLDMTTLKNVSSMKLQNENHALEMLFKAEGRRKYVTGADHNSHAANGVLTFHIITQSIYASNSIMKISKIHIVDLGGVDTVGNLSCIYKSVFEVGNANLAKSQLEQFLLVLCENCPESVLVKQRLNIAILYLKDALNSSSILRFVGHISTKTSDLPLTLSILRFSQIVRDIKPHRLKPLVVYNEDKTYEQLKEHISNLKKELHLCSIFANQDLSTKITKERLDYLKNATKEFLEDKLEDIELVHLGDVNTIMKIFKEMYGSLKNEKTECYMEAYSKAYEDFKSCPPLPRPPAPPSMLNSRKSSYARESFLSKKSKKSELDITPLPSIKSASRSVNKSLSNLTTSTLKVRQVKSVNISRRTSLMTDASPGSSRTMEFSIDSWMQIPEELPTYDIAFATFTVEDEVTYNHLNSIVTEGQHQVKEAQIEYLAQVKILQAVVAELEKRKEELLHIQMQMNLNGLDEPTIKHMEKTCQKVIEETNKQIVAQQEKVLTCQATLSVNMQFLHEAKKNLNEAFEHFCSEKYKTIVPDLERNEFLPEEVIEAGIHHYEACTVQEVSEKVLMYDSLRKKLEKQIEQQMKNNRSKKGNSLKSKVL